MARSSRLLLSIAIPAAALVVCIIGAVFLTRTVTETGNASSGSSPRGGPREFASIRFDKDYAFAHSHGVMVNDSWLIVGLISQNDADIALRTLGQPLSLVPQGRPPERLVKLIQEWNLDFSKFGPSTDGPWYVATGPTSSGMQLWAYYSPPGRYLAIQFVK